MQDKDPQQTWSEYYERINTRRTEESEVLWDEMREAGVTDDTIMALDFLHFSSTRENADSLAEQLSENYVVEVKRAPENDYWCIQSTTRPEGISLSKDQHSAWVEFMADVAQSHSCVFSTWSLEAPSLKKHFHSEDIDTESE